ncbi:DNA-directed RNA polymerase subunit E'' [Candidatus Woesearchaeota archaeon]|nr:DNA-directed RNA polymerase subunit E'' [Candidatus Woesearchaeota archaeon]
MKKKACKVCKIFYSGEECPNGHGSQAVTNWKGRIYIIDKENSEIGKKIGVEKSGEYAIKVT